MRVTDRTFEATGYACILCDFSPPRSGDPSLLDQASMDADFIAAAYNPGRSVRSNSAMTAAAIQRRTGKEVTFTLAPRDMNQLALQSLLLGAQSLGLENVIVVQGDPLSTRDLELTKPVADVSATGLIEAIRGLNQGRDYRGLELQGPTAFCIGATADLGRGLEPEARLARRKIEAGADFLMTQPVFDADSARDFLAAISEPDGRVPAVPVFFGLQILELDGIFFGEVPQTFMGQLAMGQSGVELALGLYDSLRRAGLHNIYLVPPIRRGGARNYDAARQFLARARRD